MERHLQKLNKQLQGEVHFDSLMKTLYSTDASVYQELPLAVAFPKNEQDIQTLIQFAKDHRTSLIPRTAGTSLAGQCVGDGIVVDVSKYFTNILEFNKEEAWVRVQPGVVRDQLNDFLRPHGLFFSPITSTANRAMIGGMVGNNSCGTTSIEYGSTRDHVISLKTILSDGSVTLFKALSPQAFAEKLTVQNLEGALYRQIQKELSNPVNQENIKEHFPKPSIHRRNTGYAIDYLLKSEAFTDGGQAFDFCKLLCGSEGTLAFTTEIKIHLNPLPKPYDVVVAAHYNSVHDSMEAAQVAMQHQPSACELMDKIILDCTQDNIEQSKNRQFVQGDPKGVLLVEFRGDTKEEAELKADVLIKDMQKRGKGYAFPKVYPPATKGVWKLRSAGLGLLSNIPGDKKAVACIEDTAVALEDLADYIDEFEEMMKGFGQRSVYYAHAGAGEIHLRPILDLKKSEGVKDFYKISEASAKLVKKYNGSLSGEHGDGRVRAAFIPMMVGPENYALFQRIKKTWDVDGIFNPGKIVDASPMDSSLRYLPEQETPAFDTLLDFSETGGILRMAEKCNGSGDCRKLPNSGGTMCPSYHATRNEKDTTRGRANTLRKFLTKNEGENPFNHPEIKEVMDLCLSCKGCTSECPSNVDMSSLKAEFLHQYYQTHGIPLRAKAFANIARINNLGSLLPSITNVFLKGKAPSALLKKLLRVAPQRSLPALHKTTLNQWFKKYSSKPTGKPIQQVYLFCDEFTNYNDTPIGIKAIQLLTHLGYEVKMIAHPESGRAAISKGLLKMAQQYAIENVNLFKNKITAQTPLLGIEPSAILSFRDEYPRLVDKKDKSIAQTLGQHSFLIEEFLAKEFQAGHIRTEQFTKTSKQIVLHGHCHQKALSSVEKADTIIAAPGTSCRHQIMDGTGRVALHPVEILYDALVREESIR